MRWISGILTAAVLVGSFASASGAAETGDRTGDTPAPLPEGAIKVEEGVYQAPMGRDDDGCMMYQLHAPGQAVIQAISYRRADGSFTMDKREAACGEDEPKP